MKTQTEISSECPICKNKRYYNTKQGMQKGLDKPCRSCANSIIKGGVGASFDSSGNRLCRDCKQYLPSSAYYQHLNAPSNLCTECSHKRSANYNKKVYKYKKYNITEKHYKILAQSQNNTCAICNISFLDTTKIKIDHNHTTGKVRGLLCHNCNVALGHFKDDINILKTAIKYIKNGDKQ